MKALAWNIGFGGLGRAASFWPDGGAFGRPSSRAEVSGNVAGIIATLRAVDADILLLQEVSRGGLLSRGVDIMAALTEAFPGHCASFQHDASLGVLGLNWPLSHGKATLTKDPHSLCAPGANGPADTRYYGVLTKHHGSLTVKLDTPDLVVANVHLDPYGADAEAKLAGARAALNAARDRAAKHVLCGGDFNMLLAPTIWAHTRPASEIAWAVPFGPDGLPGDMVLHVDPTVPTNRSLDAPFQAGTSHQTVIDGFTSGPGIAVTAIRTLDLGFAHSDHNPVVIEFDLKGSDQ